MTPRLVYDDGVMVPSALVAITGVDRFGRFILHGATAREVAAQAARGLAPPSVVSSTAERQALGERTVEAGGRVILMTSDILESRAGALSDALALLTAASADTLVHVAGGGPTTVLGAFGAGRFAQLLVSDNRRALLADWGGSFDAIEAPGLASMLDSETFMSLVGGAAHARSFNQIVFAHDAVTKRSSDEQKARAEHDFWYQLPPDLQRYVVRPTHFVVDPSGLGGASYRMPRYELPDAAFLWIHRGLTGGEMATFFDAVFEWLRSVPVSTKDPGDELYVSKVRQRVHALLAAPAGRSLDARIAQGTQYGGLMDVLVRYERLHARDRGPKRSAVAHGDLCLSNILYDKRSGVIRLIDPRGATSPEQTWLDATYDLAKLSQCVLGGYDFINRGLFDIPTSPSGALSLRLHEPRELAADKAEFVQRLVTLGYPSLQVRLREASLFLSMLPLHQESSGKLLAFVLNAIAILDEVEAAANQGQCAWLDAATGNAKQATTP
jgi:hypothetical protein